MKRSYHILDRNHNRTRKKLAAHLARQGQLLLPLLELVEQTFVLGAKFLGQLS